MTNKLLLVLVVAVVAVGVFFALRGSSSPPVSSNVAPIPSLPPADTPTEVPAKTFTIEALNFFFDIKEVRVQRGDLVKIILVNKEGTHDWVVDELAAFTQRVSAGQSDTVSFVADKTGEFEYYCSVGDHRRLGMVGKLIVE